MGLPQLGPPWRIGMVEVSRDQWIAAAVIAGLRTASNDDRALHRSRGQDKNVLNDIQGAIGEVIALRALEQAHGRSCVSHSILDWDGGKGPVRDEVDLVIDLPGYGTLWFESKCHLDASRKRMLLVNRTAHERSMRREALGYVPVVGVLGHERACIGHLIHHEELDRWPAIEYGYHDVALGRPLEEISPELFGASWGALRAALRTSHQVVSEETLRGVAVGAERRFDELRSSAFELAGLSHDDVVATARGEARACWAIGGGA